MIPNNPMGLCNWTWRTPLSGKHSNLPRGQMWWKLLGRRGQAKEEQGEGKWGCWAAFIHQGLHIEGSAPGKKGGRADRAGVWGEGDLGGEDCSLGLSLFGGTLGEWVGLEGGEGVGGVCRWRGWGCKEGRFRGDWVGDRGRGPGVPTDLVPPASVVICGRDFSKWFSKRAPRVLSIPGQLRSRLCTSCMHWI